MLNRRTFVKASAAAGTLAHWTDPLHAASLATGSGTGPAGQPAWLRTLRRIGQTNITEHDPAVLDVEAWADYWSRVKVGVVYVSVTGIIAYYQTQVPFHRKSKYLAGKDFFGELNTAARKRGLRTFARMSPDLNWGDALQAHPEWFMRDQQGNAIATADTPELFQTCMFTPYMTDYMTAIMREINAHYDVDGFYMNGWPMFNLPVCYCNICRKLPPPKTPAYWDKFNDRVMELWDSTTASRKRRTPKRSTSPTWAAASTPRPTSRRSAKSHSGSRPITRAAAAWMIPSGAARNRGASATPS